MVNNNNSTGYTLFYGIKQKQQQVHIGEAKWKKG